MARMPCSRLAGLAAFSDRHRSPSSGSARLPVLGAVALIYFVVGIGSIQAARIAGRGLQRYDVGQRLPADPALDAVAAGLAGLMVLCAVAFLIEDAVSNWSALHLEADARRSPALGSAAPGVFALAMFFGRLARSATGRSLLRPGAPDYRGVDGRRGHSPSVAAAPTPTVALVFVGSGRRRHRARRTGAVRARRPPGPSTEPRGAIARLTSFGYTGFLVGPPFVGLALAGLRPANRVRSAGHVGTAARGWRLGDPARRGRRRHRSKKARSC